MLRRILGLLVLAALLLAGAALVPGVRSSVRALVRPEAPPPITPLALATPRPAASTPPETPTLAPTTAPSPPPATGTVVAATAPPTATPLPTAAPSPTAIVVNGRTYEAYTAAASKEGQDYQYSCEFDAAWVIVQTFGVDASVDDLIGRIAKAPGSEPYIGEQTPEGHIIYGGDITAGFAGDYTKNFLARSTGSAIQPVFESYGMRAETVRDRAGVEAALRAGGLVWMKTTVDFKPWRPAIWRTPDGSAIPTVLGNDHAVVAIGFNEQSVVIRDVLGPTSSNWQRPYEYEVDWDTFLSCWGAQGFDGLAVFPPAN